MVNGQWLLVHVMKMLGKRWKRLGGKGKETIRMNKKDGGQCGNHKKKVGLPCQKKQAQGDSYANGRASEIADQRQIESSHQK